MVSLRDLPSFGSVAILADARIHFDFESGCEGVLLLANAYCKVRSRVPELCAPMKTPLEVLELYPPHDYTLAGAFASRASRDAQRAFMAFEDRTWSWASFDAEVCKLASALLARGLARGDRVAVSGRNTDGHVLILFALARIGAIMVPVNPEFGVEEARYVLHHAEVSGVVASMDTLEIVRRACDGLAALPWFLMLDAGSDGVDSIFAAGSAAAGEPVTANVTGDDTVLIVYTSGTTGFPKGAMHSQRNFVTGGEAFVQRVSLQDDDRVMIVLPLFHINALFYSLAGTLAAGCGMIVAPRFSASTF